MLDSLDHLIIAVADVATAAARTASLLGLRPSWRGEHPVLGTANALFRLENTYLELLAPAGPGPVSDLLRSRLESRGEGLVGIAFGTHDAAACRAAWLERGLTPGEVELGMGRDVDSGAFREWSNVPLPARETRGVMLFAIQHRSPADLLPPATAAADPRSVVTALDHVVVQSGDPEATRALYGDALGIRLALDKRFDDWGVRLLFFRIGGTTVEVAARLDPQGSGADRVGSGPSPTEDRLWGISYRVPDADAARARLAGSGFEVSEVRPGRKPGTRVFTVHGEPCGVATLVLEPAPGRAGAPATEGGD